MLIHLWVYWGVSVAPDICTEQIVHLGCLLCLLYVCVRGCNWETLERAKRNIGLFLRFRLPLSSSSFIHSFTERSDITRQENISYCHCPFRKVHPRQIKYCPSTLFAARAFAVCHFLDTNGKFIGRKPNFMLCTYNFFGLFLFLSFCVPGQFILAVTFSLRLWFSLHRPTGFSCRHHRWYKKRRLMEKKFYSPCRYVDVRKSSLLFLS